MIEQLAAKPGVIALRVTGHIARTDVDECFKLITRSFEIHPKVDLYVEAAGLIGFDTEALTQDFQLAWNLLGKLDKFGRIAVVSDQTWIRWASRLESALLPGISYRTYTLAERQHALDWVQGRETFPYGPAIKIIETTRVDTIGIEIDGRLSAEEMSATARYLNYRRHTRPLKAILLRFRALNGFDPKTAVNGEYLQMKLGLACELDRYAIVGGPDCIDSWANLIKPLLRLELRHFPLNDEDAAWSWLSARPVADHPVAA